MSTDMSHDITSHPIKTPPHDASVTHGRKAVLTQTQHNQIKRARQAIDRDIFTEVLEIDDSFALSKLYGEALEATDTSDESACFRMWGTMEVEVKILLGIIAELTGVEL